MFEAQQQAIFAKLDDVRQTVSASNSLVVQQCQSYVDNAVQPALRKLDSLDEAIKQQRLVAELHNQRFERLEKMLEIESTTRPAAPNSRDYARQPDSTI
eukprot:12312241-Karenia_brevis.AAC.1